MKVFLSLCGEEEHRKYVCHHRSFKIACLKVYCIQAQYQCTLNWRYCHFYLWSSTQSLQYLDISVLVLWGSDPEGICETVVATQDWQEPGAGNTVAVGVHQSRALFTRHGWALIYMRERNLQFVEVLVCPGATPNQHLISRRTEMLLKLVLRHATACKACGHSRKD